MELKTVLMVLSRCWLLLEAPLPPLSQHPVLAKKTYDEQDKLKIGI
jgi:hypothetical protein